MPISPRIERSSANTSGKPCCFGRHYKLLTIANKSHRCALETHENFSSSTEMSTFHKNNKRIRFCDPLFLYNDIFDFGQAIWYIRGSLVWNKHRVNVLLKLTWFTCLSSAISAAILNHHTGVNVHDILDLYIYPTFDTAFIIIAGVTYGVKYSKYKKSSISSEEHTSRTSEGTRPSIFTDFQRSRVFIPVLLTTTLTLFIAIPSLVRFFCLSIGNINDVMLNTTLRVLFPLGSFIDALIYVWINKSVRQLLKKKLGIKRGSVGPYLSSQEFTSTQE